jgi:tetratricopeptide (TPR) repeat protein
MYKGIISGLVLSLAISSTSLSQVYDPASLNADPATATSPISPRLSGLSDYHFKVTTDNEESQYFFDQGMRLVFAFNHSEALRSFKEAARLDPDNAMAYWGWAWSLGRNLNIPMMMNSADQANDAIYRAIALKDKVTERERDYIEVLEARYNDDLSIPRETLDIAYMNAAEKLMNKYPDDLDAAVLYAGAAMNTQPWDYWYLDGNPKGNTEKIISVLESVIERDPKNAGALHYHIHVTEFKKPWLAEDSADALHPLLPGSGHLVHMPSHIYIRVGRYQDAYDINIKAVEADEEYIKETKSQSIYPLVYYPHNIHFLSWSSMFTGRSQNSLDAAMKVKEYLEEGVRKTSWGSGNEYFRAQPIYVMVRFGKWDEILEMPKPFMKAQFLTGMWRYGRSLAYLHTGDIEKAESRACRI